MKIYCQRVWNTLVKLLQSIKVIYSWLTINVLVTCLQGIVLTIVFTHLSGRGVFALVPFNKGDFVIEYREK